MRDRMRDRKGVDARPVAVERDRETIDRRHPIRAGMYVPPEVLRWCLAAMPFRCPTRRGGGKQGCAFVVGGAAVPTERPLPGFRDAVSVFADPLPYPGGTRTA